MRNFEVKMLFWLYLGIIIVLIVLWFIRGS